MYQIYVAINIFYILIIILVHWKQVG